MRASRVAASVLREHFAGYGKLFSSFGRFRPKKEEEKKETRYFQRIKKPLKSSCETSYYVHARLFFFALPIDRFFWHCRAKRAFLVSWLSFLSLSPLLIVEPAGESKSIARVLKESTRSEKERKCHHRFFSLLLFLSIATV